ncbi:MAG: VCBS repeat-containing protein [Alphaproteobacteria bacterium]|nr:VCBS repeat-containing protein [Alphaproteobacteria bacterium]
MLRPFPLLVVLTGCGVAAGPAASDDTVARPGPDLDTEVGDTPADTRPTGSPDTAAPDTDPLRAPAQLVVGPEVVCAQPQARAERPFDPWTPEGAFAAQDVDTAARPLFSGGGVAVADLDGDGDLDLFRTSARAGFAWFDLGTDPPADRTAELPDLPSGTAGVVAVDVEGDGDLDLHVTAFGAPDRLYRNDGGTFVDVAVALGLAGPADGLSLGAAWADADGDGDLDAFVGAYGPLGPPFDATADGEPSHLYLQQADGTFTDAVADLPADHPLRVAFTYQGAFVELDGDPTPELYAVNDFGPIHPSVAWDLVDGQPVARPASGLESALAGMGLGLGDLGRDGVEDLVVPAVQQVGVYVSLRSGFFESAAILGVRVPSGGARELAWGAELADLDSDGDLDLLVPFGQLHESGGIFANAPRQPDALWVQHEGFFTDAAEAWGLDHRGIGRGVVVVDLDGDGWLDLVQQDLVGPTRVQRARCGAAAWLGVRPRQAGANPFAVGTRVVVVDGEDRWLRTVRAGGTSYASAGPPEVVVGLGDRDAVERVEIHWPDGTMDAFDDVPTRRWLEVRR